MSLKKNQIFTHRGLEPSNTNFFPESSIEAFENQLSRGFGIEFDPNFTKDGVIVSHDATLKRITDGKDIRTIHDVRISDITCIWYGNGRKGHIPTLNEIFELIRKSKSKINALHLKGKFQDKKYLERLLDALKNNLDITAKLLIFDAKPGTAKFLKRSIPTLLIAPSVSHPYDIKRYNNAVLGTLISVEDALKYRKEGLYEWVWLDEWDLADEGGKTKTLFNKDVFSTLKNAGYKISLVTPELHGTSPGLLGGEAHPDAQTKEKLFARIRKIISLQPEAICTDYPEEVLKI